MGYLEDRAGLAGKVAVITGGAGGLGWPIARDLARAGVHVAICDRDADGMAVTTLDGQCFLAVNGVQTLSHGVHVAAVPPARLRELGIGSLRLSPHSLDMVAVAKAFRALLDDRIGSNELLAALNALDPPGTLVSGYLTGAAGSRASA